MSKPITTVQKRVKLELDKDFQPNTDEFSLYYEEYDYNKVHRIDVQLPTGELR